MPAKLQTVVVPPDYLKMAHEAMSRLDCMNTHQSFKLSPYQHPFHARWFTGLCVREGKRKLAKLRTFEPFIRMYIGQLQVSFGEYVSFISPLKLTVAHLPVFQKMVYLKGM